MRVRNPGRNLTNLLSNGRVGLRYWSADGRVSDQTPARRAIPPEVTGETRGRKHRPASAGDRPEPQVPVAGVAEKHRPADLRLDIPTVPLCVANYGFSQNQQFATHRPRACCSRLRSA